jgi:hypothetical protein
MRALIWTIAIVFLVITAWYGWYEAGPSYVSCVPQQSGKTAAGVWRDGMFKSLETLDSYIDPHAPEHFHVPEFHPPESSGLGVIIAVVTVLGVGYIGGYSLHYVTTFLSARECS